MRSVLLLPFLLMLSLDFATLDAPLVPMGSRHLEVDDEEESVPSRPTRVRREARLVIPTVPGHGDIAPTEGRLLSEHIARTARRTDPPPWLGPITQARLSSAGPASPPEDH